MAEGSPSRGSWPDAPLHWTEEEYIHKRHTICSRSPLSEEREAYKVLLYGPTGSGKSSFINTIYSAIRGKISQIAFNSQATDVVTKRFRVHRFRESKEGRAIRVNICDTKGFDHTEANRSPLLPDLESILDGHILEGYEFESNKSIDDKSPYYNPTPGHEKIDVIVIVIKSSNANQLCVQTTEKLLEIAQKADERHIPWVVLLTNIDNVSRDIANDVTCVYDNADIARCAETVSNRLGIPKSRIFPVQSYTREIIPSLAVNILALHTLERILDFADNSLEIQRGISQLSDVQMELMPSPWRSEDQLSDEAVHTMWTKLENIEPTCVPKLRICLMGPSGGGKSAFINSAMSEMYQRIVSFADTECMDHLTTKTYNEYILKQGRDGAELKIILCDTMGVLALSGLNREDTPTILDGQVSDNEEFDTMRPLSRPDSPVPLSNRPHVLALVLNGAEIDSYSPELIEKMQSILTTARAPARELQTVVLVTHIDEVCRHVAADPTKVFRSQEVKTCLEKVQRMLDVPLPDIWPVVNFADDTEVDWKKSALILQALHQLVLKAQDYIMSSSVEIPAPTKFCWFF